MKNSLKITTISQFHEIVGLPSPEHPLISIIDENNRKDNHELDDSLFNLKFTTDLYTIMFKDGVSGSLGYGRTTYDFQEGTLLFMSPGQVVQTPSKEEMQTMRQNQGWTLLFHPDLIRKSALGEIIEDYSFFSYESNEALHLSAKEEKFILEMIHKIKEEYSQNIDQHSQRLIISNLELLLNYCTRFYDRQFYTRTNQSKDIVIEFEKHLKKYFKEEKQLDLGIPSIQYFAKKAHLSQHYFSDLIKKETMKTPTDHINDFVIEKAKNLILQSGNSMTEIAYDLGFNYPHYFGRLFKSKTGKTPLQYRNMN